MGNQPSGWVAPPYYTEVATVETGTAPGGATLLAAGPVDSNPATVAYAVYKFFFRMTQVDGLLWSPCSFFGLVGPSVCTFQVRFVTANFNTADGQPTPASTLAASNTYLLSAPGGAPPYTTFALERGGFPPGGPYWGCVIVPVETGIGSITSAGWVPPMGVLRWHCTAVGVVG